MSQDPTEAPTDSEKADHYGISHKALKEAGKLASCPFCNAPGQIEHSYHEDNLNPPRDFWHVRAICSQCEASPTGWFPYGEQEARKQPAGVKARAEARAAEVWNRRPTPPVQEEKGEAMREALQRLADATPQSTNTVSAEGAFSYVHAVARTALDTCVASPTPAPETDRELIERLQVLARGDENGALGRVCARAATRLEQMSQALEQDATIFDNIGYAEAACRARALIEGA